MKVSRLFIFRFPGKASDQEVDWCASSLATRYRAAGVPVITGTALLRERKGAAFPNGHEILFETDTKQTPRVDDNTGVYLVGHGNEKTGLAGGSADAVALALAGSGLARARKICLIACYAGAPKAHYVETLAWKLSLLGATTTVAAWDAFISVVCPANKQAQLMSVAATKKKHLDYEAHVGHKFVQYSNVWQGPGGVKGKRALVAPAFRQEFKRIFHVTPTGVALGSIETWHDGEVVPDLDSL